MSRNKAPILVAVGDSDSHDAALRFAADEAVRDRRPLRLVHVVHPPREGMFPEQMLISFTAVELTGGVVPVTQALRRGGVVDHLVELSGSAHHIVLQHRQQARLLRVFTGSTAAGVAAHAHLPVVSVPELWSGPSNHDVVVGLDRDHDTALLQHAFAEAFARDARLTVLHAWYLPPLYDDALVDHTDLHHWREGVRTRIEAALLPFRARYPDVDVHV